MSTSHLSDILHYSQRNAPCINATQTTKMRKTTFWYITVFVSIQEINHVYVRTLLHMYWCIYSVELMEKKYIPETYHIEAETKWTPFSRRLFKCIFLNNNVWISINISLKFVPNGLINNIPLLVQIKAGRRSGDKPSSEPMVVRLLTHICVSRLRWVKSSVAKETGSYDTVFDMIMPFVVLNNDIKEQLWCLCKIYSLCIYRYIPRLGRWHLYYYRWSF